MLANITNHALPASKDFGLAPCIAQHSHLFSMSKMPRNSSTTFCIHLSNGISATQLLICRSSQHIHVHAKSEAKCANKKTKLIGTFKLEQLEGHEDSGGTHLDT